MSPVMCRVFARSVEEVDLSGFLAVDAEWLAYLGSFRYLRMLKLADCKNVDNDAVWSLSGEIPKLTRSSDYTLHHGLYDQQYSFLLTLGMYTLKELDLSRCKKISDAGLKHIVTIESLEKLHLSETELSDNGVMLISSLTNLSFLDLGGILVTDKSLQSLQV